MAELAVHECWNANEREIAVRFTGDEAAEGHFGCVELVMHAHAPMHFRRSVDGDEVDFHPFGAHRAVFEGPHDVVVATAEVER